MRCGAGHIRFESPLFKTGDASDYSDVVSPVSLAS